MMTVRRVASLGVLALLMSILGLALAGSASAYPAGQTATATANTAFVPGQSFSITLNKFTPGMATATLSPGGQVLGSVMVPGSGTATLTGTIPSNLSAGSYAVVVTGAGGEVVQFPFMVGSGAAVSGSSGSSGSSGGSLAYTGAAVAGIGVLGAALVAGGVFFVLAGRRRTEKSTI